MSMTSHAVTLRELAEAIARRLGTYIINPTRFRANLLKTHVVYGCPGTAKAGRILMKIELPGNFTAELEIDPTRFSEDAHKALDEVVNEVREAHFAAAQRRHDTRAHINRIYRSLSE